MSDKLTAATIIGFRVR